MGRKLMLSRRRIQYFSSSNGVRKGLSVAILVIVIATGGVAGLLRSKSETASAGSGTETLTLYPDGEITTTFASQTGTEDNTCIGGTNSDHCDYVDEASLSTSDYVRTGTSGSDGDEEEYTMSNPSPSNTPDAYTQIVVTVHADVVSCEGGNCDSLTVRVAPDGSTYTSGSSSDLSTTASDYTFTFNGSWGSVDSLQVEIVRNVNGGGNPNNRDDDVRMYQVYADATYSYTDPPPSIQLEGYIWESDDGSSADGNTALAAKDTALTGVQKGQRLTLRTHLKNTSSGSLTASENLALFYDRNDGYWTKVQSGVPAQTGSESGCASTLWTCSALDTTDDVGDRSNMAINPVTGAPMIAYQEFTGSELNFAYYVGSGGTGCATDEWTCELVEATNDTGRHVKLAVDQDGKPWIAHADLTDDDVMLAEYVGSGGSGCDSSAWTCTTIVASSQFDKLDIGISPSGVPWVSFVDDSNGDIAIAEYVGSGGDCDSVYSGSDAWECSILMDTVNATSIPAISFDAAGNPIIATNDASAHDLLFIEYIGGGSGSGCADSDWTCTTVWDTGGSTGRGTSISLDSSGDPWISHNTTTGTMLVSIYVTSGGNCDNDYSGSDAWDCIEVDSISTFSGEPKTSLQFAVDGTAWISYADDDGSNDVRLARYVGSGGTGCSGTATFTCIDIETTGAVGEDNSLVIDKQGVAWIAYSDETTDGDLRFATYNRGGEITMSSSGSGDTRGSVTKSHADMTSVTDTTNQGDADCLSATSWNNGVFSESDTVSGLTLPAGDTTSQCTEVAWTVDTSQATEGTTYRFVVATEDSYTPWRSGWRGLESISQYPTLTIDTADRYANRFSKGVNPTFANCTDTDWGCLTVDATDNVGDYSSITFDHDGKAWVSYHDATNGYLMVGNYVGDGSGSGCGGGSSDWTCTIVEDDATGTGSWSSIGTAPDGSIWVAFEHDSASDSLGVAQYVGGSGGDCTSTAWDCHNVGSSTIDGARIGFNPAGKPSIVYQGDSSDTVEMAQLLPDGTWDVQVIFDAGSITGERSSIAYDSKGKAYISYPDWGDGAVYVAEYVGAGGTGCTGATNTGRWKCTAVDNMAAGSLWIDTSIVVDKDDNPIISYYDSDSEALAIATYVGTGGNCTSTAWDCGIVDDVGGSSGVGQWSSIGIDGNNELVISYYDVDNTALRVARSIESTGSGCTGETTSLNWICETVDNSGADGEYSNVAIDRNGTPWVSYEKNAGDLGVAKLHKNSASPTDEAVLSKQLRSAMNGDMQFRLDSGRANADAEGVCSGVADAEGYCGIFANDGNYDSLALGANEEPLYVFALKYQDNTVFPSAQWVGCSTLAPSTAGTAGDVTLQVYRHGTSDNWEGIATDSSSGACSSDNMSLSGSPSGTLSEYFESDGSDYWVYFRVTQVKSTSSYTFKTDGFKAVQTQSQLRHGAAFRNQVQKPFGF